MFLLTDEPTGQGPMITATSMLFLVIKNFSETIGQGFTNNMLADF